MKFLSLFTLIFAMNLGAATPEMLTMVTTTQIQLDKLFYSFDSIDFRDHDFPEKLAHSYTIRTTYQYPDNLSAVSTTRETLPYRSCPYNQCTNYPGYKTETVILRSPDFKIIWELIDGKTNKVISTETSLLKLEFAQSGDTAQSTQLAGFNKKGSFDILDQRSAQGIKLNIPNPYTQDKVIISYAREFATQRLTEMRFNLKMINHGEYQISEVNFTKEATKTIYKTQGAMMDFNRDRIGFYFGMAGTDPKSPTLMESTISHD